MEKDYTKEWRDADKDIYVKAIATALHLLEHELDRVNRFIKRTKIDVLTKQPVDFINNPDTGSDILTLIN